METDKILIEIASVDQVFADKISQIVAKEKGGFEKVRRNLSILRSLNTDNLASEALTKFQIPSKFIQIIELLRNSLILVPISLTWLSLAYSVSLFATLPSSDSFPFLILWEQGFGGQMPDYLRFSQVAIIDASLVGVIIIFTLIDNVKIHIFDENALKRTMLLKQRVNQLLMEIESDLYKKYAALAPTEEKNLEAIVAQFDKLASSVETQNRSLLNYIAAEQERLSRLSEVQLENARELQNAATTFYQATSVIVDTTQSLKNELQSWNGLGEKSISLLERNTSRVVEAVEQVAGLGSTLGTIQNAVEMLDKNQQNTRVDLAISLDAFKSVVTKLDEALDTSVRSIEITSNKIVDAFSSKSVYPASYPMYDSAPVTTEANVVLSLPNTVPEDSISKTTLQNIVAYSSFIPIIGFGFGSVSLVWSLMEKVDARLMYLGLGGIAFNAILASIIIIVAN